MAHTRLEIEAMRSLKHLESLQYLASIAESLKETSLLLAAMLSELILLNSTHKEVSWRLGQAKPAFPRDGYDQDDYGPPEDGWPFVRDDEDIVYDSPDEGAAAEQTYRYAVMDSFMDIADEAGTSYTICNFHTLVEAQACMVGLDYLDRAGSKEQRYEIVNHESEGER